MAPTTNTNETSKTAELLLFGDLTASFEADLNRLLHVSQDEALTSFFERVAFSLREELGRHSSAVQDMFPRFTTLIDLVARLGETEGAPVLQFCLMTVCQLAKFIHFAKDRPFPRSENTLLLGSCTGVEATRVAFRTALRSLLQRSIITTTGDKSWSAVVLRNKPVEQLVNSAKEKKLSRGGPSRIYISATSPTNTTISGPPDVLDQFLEENSLQSHRLSIESPFHAAHLFSDGDVDFTLAGYPEAALQWTKPQMPLLSGSSGEAVEATDLQGLLRVASMGVLQQVVKWEEVLAATAAALGELQVDRCVICPFYCNATTQLSSYLAHETSFEVAVQNMISTPKQQPQGPTGRFDQSKIAIVGFSGRYPEAPSNDELWNLLRAGRDVHREIPKERFNWETYHDPTGKGRNTNRVKHGCFINEPGLFDTRFFNMSPREADSTDPAHRLAITATYEAMEMAGMVPNRTPSTQQDRIGVFFGVTSDDWREVNSSQNVDTYFIPGGVRAFMPGRISYFFRFSGPSLCIDTACSSSFAAIQSACGYLLRGECDTAVAGGTNVLTNPDIFTGLDRGHFLAKSGNCNTFDDEASGYCRAEAVGAVILKRLEDALEDGDPVYGVIAGANTNHCGQSESITRPHEGDQVSVFKRVMRYQGVDPNHISYVEMHGTGTQAGDATEMRSVLSVFLPDKKRPTTQPLYLGSAKANIGHSESASGVVSMIKVLLMMKNNEIPPHCGIKTRINRNYPSDLADRNVRIALEPTPWRREDSVGATRRVFLNNFSAAGGNTAILLEDAPLLDQATGLDPRGTHLVTVTAKSATALAANIRSMLSYLEANPSVSLPSLAYTTTARRLHHGYRVACSGASVDAIVRELAQRAQSEAPKPVPGPVDVPGVAFVFTGQGGLYAGVGQELFQSVPGFRDDVVRFDAIAQQLGFPSFLSLVDGSASSLDGVDTCASHLALTSVQMALCRLWSSWNIRPSMVTGHSLGEYAALYCAKVISASDAIFLVGTRATLLAKSCTPGTHAMLAIKEAVDVVRPFLAESGCEVTCVNQPLGTVVGGPKENIDKLAAKVKSLGSESVLLAIPFSFHTAQVDPILGDFEKAAQGVQYHTPEVPVLSPLLERVVRDEPVFNAQYLARACRGVVNFQGALEAASAASLVGPRTIWLELGPHPACSAMIKGTLGSEPTTLTSLRKSTPPWKCIVSALESMYVRGLPIDWNNYHRDFAASHHVVDLPRYSWDLKNHWIEYKNDWLLTKGVGTAAPQSLPAIEAPVFRYISPSVQRVLEETQSATRSTLLAESDLFDGRLAHILRGHMVNGASLCPSSLYGDVALTVAKTLVQGNAAASFTGFDVCDMKIDRPLIALPSETSHLFRVSATADWTSQIISLSIYSVGASGTMTMSHASVNVRLSTDKAAWLNEWKPMAYLINGRIASLERGVISGNCHRLKRAMVYKLFGSLVDYSDGYQGMQEVILDSEELEATAKVSFRVDDQGFVVNPQWIDSLGHLAGFIMNGNEHVQSDKQVFINHGWNRLRFAETPEKGKVYTTYNRMQLVEGKLYAGDTYILDGDRIVGVFDKVAFQGVPRKVLDNLLPGKATTKAPAGAKAAPVAPTPAQAPVRSAAPPPPAAVPKASGDFGHVLSIIAEEVGIELAELQPDSLFADFGLDSLLALTAAERIHDETGMDLPSTFFAAYPTVKDLQSLLDPEYNVPRDTPSLTSASNTDYESSSSSLTAASSVHADVDFKVVIRQTIADETGTPAEELTPTTCLADIGIDSLLGLTIADCLSEALGAEVSSTLLLENGTLEEIEACLKKVLAPSVTTKLADPAPVAISLPQPDAVNNDIVSSAPHATSIVLRRAKTTQGPSRAVFLLPDGSGSAASYGSLARLDPHTAVYGLNCPWRTNPHEMTQLGVTTDQVVSKFTAEIQRIQPHGPYLLGGWSAGGIFAFEAARKLMAAGEVVERLLLIDAPNPIGLENPPSRMFDFFESAGVFGNMSGHKAVPSWLRHHFDSVVNMLDGYVPRPLANAPPTTVIYARDGICKDPSVPHIQTAPDDPREMLWLLRDRTDFSAAGWASLIGAGKISVQVLDNVNHFTMMNEGSHMEEMREFVRRGILGQ
ncbi:starter unit:ACP transacylase in aflatoxin biosynthesis domain-containing protein [Hirsutella rhossiliensis]|uniref:Starter unit:ACP transacylase in aflatoxin biosynthesis domain-containing protein n=1 Tax=Hirsutella rhossiliensis TaxID=111463 RepID=A0A9P8MZP8_9HYPO|nr:starter unit:ACP transacylase in aflatoxin biosynthesis domain-containing protein [Hirsutella rhossiliensis]KAH0964215.1 starter unit:ACP transacylase in aflatoxin biosynthesis domain-containing protein [Hirsutella rhossiliensis]